MPTYLVRQTVVGVFVPIRFAAPYHRVLDDACAKERSNKKANNKQKSKETTNKGCQTTTPRCQRPPGNEPRRTVAVSSLRAARSSAVQRQCFLRRVHVRRRFDFFLRRRRRVLLALLVLLLFLLCSLLLFRHTRRQPGRDGHLQRGFLRGGLFLPAVGHAFHHQHLFPKLQPRNVPTAVFVNARKQRPAHFFRQVVIVQFFQRRHKFHVGHVSVLKRQFAHGTVQFVPFVQGHQRRQDSFRIDAAFFSHRRRAGQMGPQTPPFVILVRIRGQRDDAAKRGTGPLGLPHPPGHGGTGVLRGHPLFFGRGTPGFCGCGPWGGQ